MLQMTSSRTSAIMSEEKFKMSDLLRFFAFYSVGATVWKVFHVFSSNLLCMLLISSSRTSSIMAGKKLKMDDLLTFFAFYGNNLTSSTKTEIFFMYPSQMHITNDQFSDMLKNY